jgi:predicted acyl esterase
MKKLLFVALLVISTSLFATTVRTVGENYTKKEVHIKMRDGVSLYTVIYTPKDHSKKYPIIMQRIATAVRLMVLISLRKYQSK